MREVEQELKAFDEDLWARPRWLVLNKIDTIGGEMARVVADELVQETGISPVFLVSAATGEGCRELVNRIMQALDEMREQEAEDMVEAGENE